MKKFLDFLEKLIKIITGILFVGIMVMIATQVFTRYILNNSLSWTEQAARIMFIWMILLYASVLTRNAANLGFDLLVNKMPPIFKNICMFFCEILIIAFAFYWAFQGYNFCASVTEFFFSGIKIPYNAVYSAEPIGAALIVIFGLELLVNHIVKIKREGIS